MSYLRSNWIRF